MSRLLSVVALLVGLLAFGGTGAPTAFPAQPAVAAEPEHAAGLVIDTGEGVKTRCVRFAEDSITGEELLRRADVDAVFAEYGSMGSAVCSLCGTGCPADDCFCEAERSGRYWNYVHAGGGGWQRASQGASGHTIRDGDVDGWAWGGQGSRPPYIPFETICAQAISDDESEAPPSSEPAPATEPQEEEGTRDEPQAQEEPAPAAESEPPPAPEDGPSPDPTVVEATEPAPASPAPSPTAVASVSPTAAGPTPAPIVPAPSPTATTEALGTGAESSLVPLLLFVVVLTVIVGATLLVRRRRDSG